VLFTSIFHFTNNHTRFTIQAKIGYVFRPTRTLRRKIKEAVRCEITSLALIVSVWDPTPDCCFHFLFNVFVVGLLKVYSSRNVYAVWACIVSFDWLLGKRNMSVSW